MYNIATVYRTPVTLTLAKECNSDISGNLEESNYQSLIEIHIRFVNNNMNLFLYLYAPKTSLSGPARLQVLR